MEQYISKSAVVAEIDRLKNEYLKHSRNDFHAKWACGVLDNILHFIDTLEMKEVDLEKSISDWLSEGLPNDEELIDYIKETAEHFFELGLKAQKGE